MATTIDGAAAAAAAAAEAAERARRTYLIEDGLLGSYTELDAETMKCSRCGRSCSGRHTSELCPRCRKTKG